MPALASRRRRGAQSCAIRFFLGRTQAIGVLALGMQPVLWHTFDLPAEDRARRDHGHVLDALDAGAACRIGVPIDTVIVHGRPELELGIKPEVFRERTGARLLRCGEPGYEPVGAALGTALANPLTETNGAQPGARVQTAGANPGDLPLGRAGPPGGCWSRGCQCFSMAGSVELETQLKTTEVSSQSISMAQEPGSGQAGSREESPR